jgi:hypothetical protein
MGKFRQTHTFALLEVSPFCFDEIADKLREVGYTHALLDDETKIDMHGIALVAEKKEDTAIGLMGSEVVRSSTPFPVALCAECAHPSGHHDRVEGCIVEYSTNRCSCRQFQAR